MLKLRRRLASDANLYSHNAGSSLLSAGTVNLLTFFAWFHAMGVAGEGAGEVNYGENTSNRYVVSGYFSLCLSFWFILFFLQVLAVP